MDLIKDEDGVVIVSPVVGWRTDTMAGLKGLLSLELVQTVQELFEPAAQKLGQVQLGLTAEQCRLLATDLQAMAATLEEPPPGASIS